MRGARSSVSNVRSRRGQTAKTLCESLPLSRLSESRPRSLAIELRSFLDHSRVSPGKLVEAPGIEHPPDFSKNAAERPCSAEIRSQRDRRLPTSSYVQLRGSIATPSARDRQRSLDNARSSCLRARCEMVS